MTAILTFLGAVLGVVKELLPPYGSSCKRKPGSGKFPVLVFALVSRSAPEHRNALPSDYGQREGAKNTVSVRSLEARRVLALEHQDLESHGTPLPVLVVESTRKSFQSTMRSFVPRVI